MTKIYTNKCAVAASDSRDRFIVSFMQELPSLATEKEAAASIKTEVVGEFIFDAALGRELARLLLVAVEEGAAAKGEAAKEAN